MSLQRFSGILLLVTAILMGGIVFLMYQDFSANFLKFWSADPLPETLSIPTRIVFQIPIDATERKWTGNYDWDLLLSATIALGIFTLAVAAMAIRLLLAAPGQEQKSGLE